MIICTEISMIKQTLLCKSYLRSTFGSEEVEFMTCTAARPLGDNQDVLRTSLDFYIYMV